MSNVTPDEIVDLTCRAFGLLSLELKGRWSGNWQGKNRPSAMTAREVAVYLIRRHTRDSNAQILARFALSTNNPARVRELEGNARIALRGDRDLAGIVAGIEDRIDELHELRADLLTRVLGSGDGIATHGARP